MNKVFVGFVLATLLAGMFASVFSIHAVGASGTVYIRADGSIDPSTAPMQRNGDVYTLTGNITSDADGIVLERDGITIDGTGYTIQGPGTSGQGITLEEKRNVIVKNVQIESFDCGIWVDLSSNITVAMNNITTCPWGIYVGGNYPYEAGSVNNRIVRNRITYVPYEGRGITLARCLNSTISQNNVTPLFKTDSGSGISLFESINNSVSQNIIQSNHEGVYLVDSGLNNITDNSLWDNEFGILLEGSQFNLLTGNEVAMEVWHDTETGEESLEGYGITMWYPNGSNLLRNNNITGHKFNFGIAADQILSCFQDVDSSNTVNGKPIYYWVNKAGGRIPSDAGYVAVVNSTGVRVEGFDLRNNYQGILLANSTNTTIEHNNVSDNRCGIPLYFCSTNNTIHANNLTNNDEGISIYLQDDSHSQVVIDENILRGGGISLSYCDRSIFSNNTLTSAGISLSYCDKCTVSSNTVVRAGIQLFSFNNGLISSNSVADSDGPGIEFGHDGDGQCYNNTISSNNVTDCGLIGLSVEGSDNILRKNSLAGNAFNLCASLEYGLNDIDTSNTVDGKQVYFLTDQHDLVISPSTFPPVGYLALLNSSNITVRNLTITHNYCGLQLWSVSDSTFENVNLTDNCNDFSINDAKNCTIKSSVGSMVLSNSSDVILVSDSGSLYVSNSNGTVASGSALGEVKILSSSDCVIDNCIISDGLLLDYCNGTLVCNNDISAAQESISTFILTFSDNNTITYNNMHDSDPLGICIETSGNNTFFHNNFIIGPSTLWVYESSRPSWDNGCEGNYWSIYGEHDSDGDGIGDTPYTIDQNNTDRYPLVNVYWSPCDINHDLKVDMRDIGKSAKAFGTGPDDKLWNPHADITGPEPLVADGKVDMRDISLIAKHYGERYS